MPPPKQKNLQGFSPDNANIGEGSHPIHNQSERGCEKERKTWREGGKGGRRREGEGERAREGGREREGE